MKALPLRAPRMTRLRAVGLAALVACVVFADASRNEWALDDEPIIGRNERAHSAAGALEAFFSPYWPAVEGLEAGQYRPLVILSFGLDWQLSGGRAWWLHAVNILLHGAATALFVAVALAWLPPAAAAAAGLVFAVHPVHVEAVANGVGRAEMMAAIGLLGAVLAARRFRRSATGSRRRGLWAAACLAALALGLLSKEHAVVGVALIALDEWLDPAGDLVRSAPLYLAVVAVTVAWFHLWHGIAGGYVSNSEAATVRDLGLRQRLATMFPAQLEVVRLLVAPFELAADYNPQVIPRRTEWSLPASIGLLNAAAVVALSLAALRKAPAVAAGILIAIITYAPTSNLLFASGVVLAERNLYLAAGATALVAAWLWRRAAATRYATWAGIGLAVLLVSYTVTTIRRVPVWRDTASVVVEDFADHSENYRARLRVASFLRQGGDRAGALAETMAAGMIYPDDPFVAMTSVPRALDLGYVDLAVEEATRAHALRPDHPAIARLVIRSWLARQGTDSALAIARSSIALAPRSSMASETYLEVLDSLGAPLPAVALGRARVEWLAGKMGAAARWLDSAVTALEADGDGGHPYPLCWDLEAALPLARALRPALGTPMETVANALECPAPQGGPEAPPGSP